MKSIFRPNRFTTSYFGAGFSETKAPAGWPVGLMRLAAPFVVLVLLALIPLACGPKGKVGSEDRPPRISDSSNKETPRSTAPELRFDPLGLDRDRNIIAEVYRDSIESSTPEDSAGLSDSALATDSAGSADLFVDVAYDTYRIQLFNSRVFTEASLEMEIAKEIFDYTATLDYEVPYFKVRLGDFSERKAAETYLRKFVKPAGYPDGWVTRVRIESSAAPVSDSALSAYYDSLRNEIFYEETLGVWIDTLDDSLADTLGGASDDD